jgi:hypothetical protein
MTRQTTGTLTSTNSDSANTLIMLMALCRLCNVAVLVPWGISQLPIYLCAIASVPISVGSLLSYRHMTAPPENQHRGYTTVKTHRWPPSNQYNPIYTLEGIDSAVAAVARCLVLVVTVFSNIS